MIPVGGWEYPNPVLTDEGTLAGDGISGYTVGRDNATYRGLAPLKFHAQLTRDQWDIWARYTRGGTQYVSNPGTWTHEPLGWANWLEPNNVPSGAGYQQATAQVSYKQELGEQTSIDYVLSYDLFDFERINAGYVASASREDEYFGRVMLKSELNPRQQLAVGIEGSYERFGLVSPGYPGLSYAVDESFSESNGVSPQWDMLTLSGVGEYQWTLNDQWCVFLGGRIDYTEYTEEMISPRISIIQSLTDRDTLKYIMARSVRAPSASEMKYQDINDGSFSDPEQLDSLEIRYERQHNEALGWAASWYWYDIDLINWDSNLSRSIQVGTLRQWGIELEAHYRSRQTLWNVSHAFNQLDSMDLRDGRTSDVTASLYGYGRHLSSWSDHITKFNVKQQLNEQWAVDGSMRIYWGYPGTRDLQYYYHDQLDYINMEEGWEKTFRGSYFLDLGLQYQPFDQLTFRLDGYNLLGFFDEDLNKRNYGTESNGTVIHKLLLSYKLGFVA